MTEVAVTEDTTGVYTPDMFSPLQFCEVVEEPQQTGHQLQQPSERTIGNSSISQLPQNQQIITQSIQGTQPSIEHAGTLLQVSQNSSLLPHMSSHSVSSSTQPTTHLKAVPMSSPLLIVTNTSSQMTTHQHSHLSPCQSHGNDNSHMPLTNNTHVINCHENQVTAIDNKIHNSVESDKLNSAEVLKDTQLINKPHQVNQNGEKLIAMPNLSSMSSIEYILTTPLSNVQLQSSNQSVSVQQPFYQMHLARPTQDGQPLSFSALHVQGQAPTLALTAQNGLSVPTVVGIQAVTSDRYSLTAGSQTPVLNISPSTAAVATQTTQMDPLGMSTEDEPQIVFSTPTEKLPISTTKIPELTVTKLPEKTIPIKRTWRRPWKKKKEREKKQAVKKSRKIKRKRILMPKKNSVYIDPRHGPPVDTTKTVIQRVTEEHVVEPKQKRQRIKLNRNSGREYINRLGKIVVARKIGSPCNCPLKCWDRMGAKVVDIFNNFWDLCDFNLQNSYLFTCLKLCDVKRRYTKKQPAEESRRQNTFEYFVRINGKHFRVCKKGFMSSHGLTSDKRLRTLFTQMKDGALVPEPDRRGKHFRPKSVGGLSVLNTEIPNTVVRPTKSRSKKSRRKPSHTRIDSHKQGIYQPQHSTVGHISHCPPTTAHPAGMQEPHHTYIPNGELYFPSHYLEPPQAMAPTHMNQIPQCQKMLETPAYFMAGMKENTFHQ